MSTLEYKTGCGRELVLAGLETPRAFSAGFLNRGLAALTAAILAVLIPYADNVFQLVERSPVKLAKLGLTGLLSLFFLALAVLWI